MFQNKTPVAVLAGMAVAGSILMAPGVVAAPTSSRAAAWGHNGSGQLGDNSTTDSSVPVAVNTAGPLHRRSVTAIGAGFFHSCAVADGQAYCWGRNDRGELGTNGFTSSSVPVAVDTSGVLAGKTVTVIAAGFFHSCAVADGRAYCWGYNHYGQLGNNSATDSSVPVAVDTSGVLAGKTVTAIAAGRVHSCAVADGQVYCWGRNSSGQLGNNSTRRSRVPVAVNTAGLLHHTLVTAIAASGGHTAAIVVPMTSVPKPPTAVTGIKVAVKRRPVKITWKPVTAAASYRVRISKPGGEEYKAWKTTSKRVFKAKVRKGKKYRFQVAATGSGGRGPTTTKRFKAK